MPINTTCPGCQAKFMLGDHLAGKKVRCQKCKQIFAAPLLSPVAPEAIAPEAPPLRVLLVEPPSAPPAPDEPILATLVEPATTPKSEPLVVKLIGPADEEILDATLAEPVKPRKPLRRTAGSLPRDNSGGALIIVGIVCLLLLCTGVGITGAVLVATKVMPQPKFAQAEKKVPIVRKDDRGWRDKKDDKGVLELPQFLPENFDADGKVFIPSQIINGRRSYRVNLIANKRYNFEVQAPAFQPVLEIDDGFGVVATRRTKDRIFLSLTPIRTGTHTLTVLAEPGTVVAADVFDLGFAPVRNRPITPIVLGAAANVREDVLRLSDPVPFGFNDKYGPHREYRLKVKIGTEYGIKLTAPAMKAVLVIKGAPGIAEQHLANLPIEYTWKSNYDGDLFFFVATQGGELGDYTLTVSRKTDLAKEKAGDRNVAFDLQGRYANDDALTNQDPLHPTLGRTKTYLIPVAAGQSFNIEKKSTAIGSKLTLFDPRDKQIAQASVIDADASARILFDAKEAGVFRLVASDNKDMSPAYRLEIARVKLPIPNIANSTISTQNREEAGCELRETERRPALGTVHFFAWAPDGKAFFLLERDGILRRFEYPHLKHDRFLALGNGFASHGLHRTSNGLVLTRPELREIWQIDPETLAITRRMPMIGGGTFLSTPTTPQIVTVMNVTKGAVIGPALALHDPVKGEVTITDPLPTGMNVLGMSGDERVFFCRTGVGHLARLRWDEQKWTVEETSVKKFRAWPLTQPPILTSPDGKLILHPINNKIQPKIDVEPAPASDYGLVAYRVNDLSKPAFVLDTGAGIVPTTIDPKTGNIYTHSRVRGILVCDANGKIIRELPTLMTKAGPSSVFRLVAHPDGGRLIALQGSTTSPALTFIDLPKDLAP